MLNICSGFFVLDSNTQLYAHIFEKGISFIIVVLGS